MDMKKLLLEKKLDGILVTSLRNIRYHSGFSGSLAVLLIENARYNLFVDSRYTLQAKREKKDERVEVITIPKGSIEEIVGMIKNRNISRLGVEESEISHALYSKYSRKLPSVELVSLGNEVEKVRMIKTSKEIENIKKGAEILDKIYREVVEKIKDFKSEREVAAFIEYRMKMLESEGPSFDTIVAWRGNSAFPHWKASGQKIEGDGFLKIDFGCYIDGYGSDMTRTLHIGKADPKAKEIYSVVLEAQELAISKAKAGITTKELDSIARNYIISKRYGEYFKHGLGHGLGVGGGELPYISNKSEEIVLEEGMVVTIEPGIYIEGYGGVRIEDDILITKNGCINLMKTPKELIEII